MSGLCHYLTWTTGGTSRCLTYWKTFGNLFADAHSFDHTIDPDLFLYNAVLEAGWSRVGNAAEANKTWTRLQMGVTKYHVAHIGHQGEWWRFGKSRRTGPRVPTSLSSKNSGCRCHRTKKQRAHPHISSPWIMDSFVLGWIMDSFVLG